MKNREKIAPLCKSGTISNIDRMIVPAFRRKPFHPALPRLTDRTEIARFMLWYPGYHSVLRSVAKRRKTKSCADFCCRARLSIIRQANYDLPDYSVCGLTAKPLEIALLRKQIKRCKQISMKALFLQFVNLTIEISTCLTTRNKFN